MGREKKDKEKGRREEREEEKEEEEEQEEEEEGWYTHWRARILFPGLCPMVT